MPPISVILLVITDGTLLCSMCTVYDDRPDFCRVEPQKFKAMYGIEEDELNVRVLYDSTMNCIG